MRIKLYRCDAFRCWLTRSACKALKARGTKRSRAKIGKGPKRVTPPCVGCPGVFALYRRGETPPPRVLDAAGRDASERCSQRGAP